ncbi:MAG TPA: DUF59 domain-containing protein [Bacteroidota bacterium]|nr:DUF59 domain-containing protein [Bacteroidota bacterium]
MADDDAKAGNAGNGEQRQEEITGIEQKVIENNVINILHTCYDPEIPVNIYDLGLIYDVSVGDGGAVTVTMTLTSPHCPAAQSLPGEVQQRVASIQGVTSVKVDVTWTPPWNMSMMSDVAKLELGYM